MGLYICDICLFIYCFYTFIYTFICLFYIQCRLLFYFNRNLELVTTHNYTHDHLYMGFYLNYTISVCVQMYVTVLYHIYVKLTHN